MDFKCFFETNLWDQTEYSQSFDFAIGLIVVSDGKILLLERSIRSFLPYRCEIPNDLVLEGEEIFTAAKRIVYQQSGLNIVSVDRYIKHFDYQRLNGSTTKMIVFSCSCEQKDEDIHVSLDFRFGTFINKYEVCSYNVIHQFLDCMYGFWNGSPTDLAFRQFLFSHAESLGIWKFKMRLMVFVPQFEGVLLLRRNRKKKTFPLHFEFLGTSFTRYDDFESKIFNLMNCCIGVKFEGENGFVGSFDYENLKGEQVREFFFIVNGSLNCHELDIVDHSEWIFVSLNDAQELKKTHSCEVGISLLLSSYSQTNTFVNFEVQKN